MEGPKSANPAREADAELYHERQARKKKAQAQPKKAAEEWFELTGSAMNKVVKKTRSESGAVYSVYVGTRKECDHQKIKYEVR